MTQTQQADIEAAPWRERRFLVFACGNFANNLGESAYKVGLPLYIYDLTGSLRTMSLLAALAPAVVLLSPLLGAVVDHWGPRVFVVPGLLVQLTGAVALNLCVLNDHVSMPVLFGLATVVQVGGEMYRSGWIAGVRGMFPHNAARSRAALSTLFVTSNVVGPIVVAVGVGLVGYLGLLWFNVASFLAPIAVWLAGVHPPAKDRPVPRRPITLGRDIIDGWHIVKAEKRVMYVQLTALPLQFASGIGVLSFMVWYLRDHWDVSASGVSVAQGTANVGALAGSAYIAARARARPRYVLAVSVAVMTAALFAMTVDSPWTFVPCMVAFFTMRSAMTAVSAMIIVKYLPSEVLGRAEGLFNLFIGIPLLIAPLLIPVVQGALGSTAVLVALGMTAGLSLLCLARFWPQWDDSDSADSPPLTSKDVPVE
ncbi:MFS transporter [Streptomyces pseudovenezuelae]|uniref:MFS family permease n=1 Tax=Streptomyces pseudovenezuelae TaxID=67350 RepID=A0ABT6M1R6_9ACTN|nr:MFS transporter [Streptomyces pseudovenezuelae]MDH6221594.1 MFS family permease [Streptomyces pseudovenezuelae]